MQFEYEIGPEEFVASSLLYLKLSRNRSYLQWGLFSIFGGLLFIIVAWSKAPFGWVDLLLMLVGLWWLYAGFSNFFPARHYRRAYRKADLAGKKFSAEINSAGFEVVGELCSWKVEWPGVRCKGENDKVFVLCSAGTVFMFGKKYLSDPQQQELRRLSGLAPS